nr:PREDICTED: sodium channel protein Nach-like [Megachile rotundata]
MKYNYKPNLEELHSSLKYRSREYILENTLHGVPYFADQTRPKWERVMWFILTMASVLAVVAIIVIVLEKFETEPTITGLDTVTDHISIEFPKVYICFNWNHLNHLNLPQNEIELYEQVYNWTWGTTINFDVLESLYSKKNNFRSNFENMSPTCTSLISNCEYKNEKIPCNELFTKGLVAVGECCILKTVEPLKHTDISWSLEFETLNFNSPWRLYFTTNDAPSPQPDERQIIEAYYPSHIEFVTDITYTTSDISYLTLHQRKCLYRAEDTNVNECQINCLTDLLLERCHCLPWFLSDVDKKECSLPMYSCLNNHYLDTRNCYCWLRCNHTSYTVRTIAKSTNNKTKIMLRNWPAALYKREMRFGYLDLLVSFGGIASLFLGYSLLTSVEMGYYFSLRTYCGAVLMSSREKCSIITVYVMEKVRPKKDDDLKYYPYID